MFEQLLDQLLSDSEIVCGWVAVEDTIIDDIFDEEVGDIGEEIFDEEFAESGEEIVDE